MSITFFMPDYTIVGNERADPSMVCFLLLNKGEKYKQESILQRFKKLGIQCILAVERRKQSFKVASLCDMFPMARFLLFDTLPDTGSVINLAVEIANSHYLAVVWSNMEIENYQENNLLKNFKRSLTCFVAPRLYDNQGLSLPQIRSPMYQNKKLLIRANYLQKDYFRTLYPSDYTAIYHCRSFRDMGGFDVRIDHVFWQQVDFGLRIYRGGMEGIVSQDWTVRYREASTPEDHTETIDAARCYLKNIMPVRRKRVYLPLSAFFNLILFWKFSFLSAFRLYREISQWLRFFSQKWKLPMEAVIQKFLK